MKTKKQAGLLITASKVGFLSLILSLILITGEKYFVITEPFEEGAQVTFFFTLPSLNELLGPTGETDLFIPEPTIQWASLSDLTTFKGVIVQRIDPLEKNFTGIPEKSLALLPRQLRVQPPSAFRRIVKDRKRKVIPRPLPTKGATSKAIGGRIYRKNSTASNRLGRQV